MSKDCMYRDCNLCRGRRVPVDEFEGGQMTQWYEWKTKRVERPSENDSTKTVTMTFKGERKWHNRKSRRRVLKQAREMLQTLFQYQKPVRVFKSPLKWVFAPFQTTSSMNQLGFGRTCYQHWNGPKRSFQIQKTWYLWAMGQQPNIAAKQLLSAFYGTSLKIKSTYRNDCLKIQL